jgi:hypothetical protein
MLNLGLLGAVVIAALSQPVTAQPGERGQPLRAPGSYSMVAGQTLQGGPAVVYLVDGTNQDMLALRWDQARRAMVPVGYRSLSTDVRMLPGR